MGNIVEKVDVNTYLAAEQDVKVKLSAYIWCILSCKAQQVSAKDKANLSSYFDYELDDELMFKLEAKLNEGIKIGDIETGEIKGYYSNSIQGRGMNNGARLSCMYLSNYGCELFRNHVIQFDFVTDSEDIKRKDIKASVVNYYMAHFDEMGQDYATYTEYLTETIDEAQKAGADSALVKPLIHVKELLQRLHTEYSEIFKQVRGES